MVRNGRGVGFEGVYYQPPSDVKETHRFSCLYTVEKRTTAAGEDKQNKCLKTGRKDECCMSSIG